MKNRKLIYLKTTLLLGLLFMSITSCERDLSPQVELAGFPKAGDVFIDGFTGGLDYYPFGGSYLEAFSVDSETKYNGSASMRFDVPNVGDSQGAYAGAIFRLGSARDLSGYDALTFWAKGTRGGLINEIGFGQDFFENKYQVSTSLQLTTNWRKYIIPIPDPTKLVQERGMFWFAEGPENGEGYTFWIDELKFEKLGTIAQSQPAIFNGENKVENGYTGVDFAITGLTQTFNLGSGANATVNAAPSYFSFKSSNENVAFVNESGVISVVAAGTSTITATLGGVLAEGSIQITSAGGFDFAPTPTKPAGNVISVFSDTYTNITVDYYNGFWEPYQTTTSDDFTIDGDNILNYTNFNFVGTTFSNPTLDATAMTNIHFDVFLPVGQSGQLLITLKDFGNDGADGGNDDTTLGTTLTNLVAGQWNSVDIPLTLANKSKMGQIIYENLGSSLTNFWVDNIYFYN